MANFPEVTLRFHSDIWGECVDQKARIVHGYIVSEKYSVAFILTEQAGEEHQLDKKVSSPVRIKKEYVFTEEPKRLDNDAKFVNKVLVAMYEDAKQRFRDGRHTPNGVGP